MPAFFHARYNARVKRLRRIIVNVLSVLSLVLCVAAVGLWVRSYSAHEQVSLVYPWREYVLHNSRGRLILFTVTFRKFNSPFSDQGWHYERTSMALDFPDRE